jgi:H+/Cl- antiporter ClcA
MLEIVQHVVWPDPNLLVAAAQADWPRHIGVMLAAGVLTGMGQIILRRLTSGNGIDITEAISKCVSRLPAIRTIGSAVLSIVVVGMGASLGCEGAPKQVGAVLANSPTDRAQLSDEQRRLLVACGAGAGMAAAYGVPFASIGQWQRNHTARI